MKNVVLFIVGIAIGALAMYFYCCQPASEMSVTAPKGLIGPDQMTTLDKAYDSRHKLISDSLVKRSGGDNRSSWFELAEVRNYLNYAEKEAEKLGYTMDGIRVYAGAHPDQNGDSGYTTYFFVPTGAPNRAKAAMFNMSMFYGNADIIDGSGLNHGGQGDPPGANYPQ